MPGQEKMVSVTIAPASSAPNCRPEDRNYRNHGVAQGVAIDDRALGQTFGAGGADVVLAEFFQHGGANHAGEDRGQRSAHGDGRKHQVGERARAGDGQPSQLDGEKQNQDGAECEIGERQSEQADDAEQAVVPAIASSGGAYAGGNRKQNGYQQRCQRQLQSVGIALNDESCRRSD